MTNPTASQTGNATTVVHGFIQLGILFMLEKLLCSRHDCDGTCLDRQQTCYQVIAPLQEKNGAAYGLRFDWDGGLVITVEDPMMLSLKSPVIFDTIMKIKQEGFNVIIPEGDA